MLPKPNVHKPGGCKHMYEGADATNLANKDKKLTFFHILCFAALKVLWDNLSDILASEVV